MLKGININSKRVKIKCSLEKGVNLIIGKNGSGKSTIIEKITSREQLPNPFITVSKPTKFYLFDFEKDNPRVKSYITKTSEIYSRFVSHGEANNKIIKCLEKVDDSIIIMDEPEQALDIYNIELLKEIVINKYQTIIITHHPFLILDKSFSNNIIETSSNYLIDVKRCYENLKTKRCK